MEDADLQDENLDLFLSLIESRLRADFTSTDLTRLISTQGATSRGPGSGAAASALPSGNESSPSKFLRLICKVFHRAAKPVKLRVLLSVLGLDSDAMIEASSKYEDAAEVEKKKTDAIVWKLLELAEQDDEKWVRVVGGILKGIMFKSSNDQEVEDVDCYADPKCRGQTAQIELRKVSESILNSVKETHTAGLQELSKAESSTTETKAQIDSLLICKDACPTFIPFRYSLLSPETIKTIMPEVDANHHFTANMNAAIFKVDAEVEEKRAEEEGKEMQIQKQRSLAMNGAAGRGSGAPTAGRATNDPLVAGRMRGRFANTAGRGGDKGSSSFLRPTTGGLGTAVAGRMGAAGRMAGRSGSLGRLGGRVGTAGRLGAGMAGRGRAAALVGQTPLQRRVPGSTRAMLNSARPGAGGDASKMRMLDVSEVEGLTKAQNEREKLAGMTKAERRKKLLEDAAASGLRNNKKPRTDSAASSAHSSAAQNEAVETNALQQQHDFSAQPNELGSLLEKSNKLSDEDRQKIHEFFRDTSSTNPHPVEGDPNDLWKVKLNEERTVDPTSGENVKETLYLELDYRTRQYKKTKKIKRK